MTNLYTKKVMKWLIWFTESEFFKRFKIYEINVMFNGDT